jgi:uncharacterized protein YdhG (YjbR/CyaY superfamily)
MAKISFVSVDDYIAAQPPAVQPILKRVRRAIRTAAPKATEAIRYQMPAFQMPGGGALYLGAWKQHLSLYPSSALLREELGDALAPYETHTDTIRFALDEPLPMKLIERIARFRATEPYGRTPKKQTAAKAPRARAAAPRKKR